jgi:hypothetical protein
MGLCELWKYNFVISVDRDHPSIGFSAEISYVLLEKHMADDIIINNDRALNENDDLAVVNTVGKHQAL